jgi:hypothetical protein
LKEHEKAQLGPHHVAYILKTVQREVLPAHGLSEKCPQLRLFTDLTLHEELDRNPLGYEAIAKFAEAIPLHGKDGRDNKWLEEIINSGLSFSLLRLDLLAVCKQFSLPASRFETWESWQSFALPLSFEISGRPIRLLPGGGARKDATSRVQQSIPIQDHQPASITLCIDAHEKRWWNVETSGKIRMLIQVLFGGFRPIDFPHPEGWVSPFAK